MSQIRRITTIKQQVYEILRDDICSGVYAPGQQIQETELSKNWRFPAAPSVKPCASWYPKDLP